MNCAFRSNILMGMSSSLRMTRRRAFPATLIACLGWVGSSAFGAVSLVQNGTARADLVLAASASADERFAAEELVRYVERATGAKLPVRATALAGRPSVLIGLSAAPERTAIRVRQMRGEGFAIEAGRSRIPQMTGQGVMIDGDADVVVLAGNGPQGTSFAVYEFLERFAGIRWLWPGDLGEVVPQRRSLSVENISLFREPAFLWRALGPGGTLWGPADRWQKERELGVSFEHQAAMRMWERRNRFGGENIYGGHAFGEILPPHVYGPTNPEYYALFQGKRDWENFNGKHRAQLCTSNPEVVQKVIEYCRRMFDDHPGLDGVSISANDGRAFCECGPCTSLDSGETRTEEADPEMGRLAVTRITTDRMLHFGNQVAEAVSRTHPGKKILQYAYGQSHSPPVRVKAHPNLLVQYTAHANRLWDDRVREHMFGNFAEWTRAAPAFGVYEYMTQGNFPDMPRLVPDLLKLELLELQRLGSRYFQTQAGNGFSVNGLNFYVLGRLLWDPSADVSAILSDYMNAAFGPAAPAMGRYFDHFIQSWRRAGSPSVRMNAGTLSDYRDVLAAYPRELRDACRRDLDEALRVAGGEHRRRVEFVRAGFRYFEMTLQAAEATFPLLQAGWTMGRTIEAPAGADRRQFDAALDLWRKRDRYIEEHRETFVLSYMWVRYNDELRTFNPLRAAERQAGAATGRGGPPTTP
jgi:hypothetical protein